ncbi:MAG: hypothetical protein ACK5LR_01475 [Mangrovibacterium sp.]
MEIAKILNLVSQERFEPYRKRYYNDLKRSFALYQANILISQSFYSSLSILEVTLRNSINNSFQEYFDDNRWYRKLPEELRVQIEAIESKLLKSKKPISVDRIIAELNFGFWTVLFNRQYARFFWKPLIHAFPNLPSDCRKRTIVSAKLNRIRTFRNRIYHYEPIIWNIQEIVNKREEIYEILDWIEPEIKNWAISIDQFNQTKQKIKDSLLG